MSYVASVIGTPMLLDEHIQSKSRLQFARVCIKVQAKKQIPKTFMLNLGIKVFVSL